MSRFLFLIMAALLSGCTANKSGTQCTLASYTNTPTSGMELSIRKRTYNPATDYSGASVAQAFQVVQANPSPTASGTSTSLTSSTPSYAQLMLASAGSFSVNSASLTVTIESDNNGSPSGTALFTSAAVDVSSLSSSAALTRFSFSGASGGLTVNQTYWLRLKASFPASETNYVIWSATDGSTNTSLRYSLNSTNLPSLYETTTVNSFSSANIGIYRYLYFLLGC